MAIKNGQVSQVTPIDKLSVVFAVIFAVILFSEKITLIAAGGVALITLGTLMVRRGKADKKNAEGKIRSAFLFKEMYQSAITWLTISIASFSICARCSGPRKLSQ